MLKELKKLSELEHQVLSAVWSLGSGTAEQLRSELSSLKELKDSTVRTVLRRLEEKGYVVHDVANRTFVYRPAIEQQNAALQAVRQIIKKFCNGSVEKLLIGMVAGEIITPEELKKLSAEINRTADEAENLK